MARKLTKQAEPICNVHETLLDSLVPVEALQPHPKNARVGDVELIKQSLKANKQYRPIVVRKSDNVVLAGNHTLKAARELGWTHIAVDFVEVSEEESIRILIADNRTSDVGSTDNKRLAGFLKSLPNLEGTGYNSEFLRRQLNTLNSNALFKETIAVTSKGHKPTKQSEAKAVFKIGQIVFCVRPDPFTQWLQENPDPLPVAAKLKWPVLHEGIHREPKGKAEVEFADFRALVDGESVAIDSLRPIPGSPRRGNIDKIMDSLRTNGQYRRVIVNKRNNRVVVNWSVVAAAKKIGWTEIRVVMIDVDEAQEKAIHAVDNRAAEMAHYDEMALCDLLSSLPTMAGTGYTEVEMRRLMEDAGAMPAMEAELPKAYLMIKFVPTGTNWMIAATWDAHQKWYSELMREARYSDDGVCKVIGERLGISPDEFREKKF